MSSSSNVLWLVIGGLLIIVLAVLVLDMPDRRTPGERLGDAVDALPHGVNKAADQLGDRTPLQKAGDATSKAGDDVKHDLRKP